ncbi:HAD family hydrolase [uncultured Adlercreutzia sp.]|uniref:HAD family hydrolase n=1 Tax=uncultured Adlercreutzia sp. TaxID=875803 RepID=UPI0025DBD2BA|nr:HAD-IA family hydrolase [uncultured Adlercreutzia sp.]MCI9262510.1 HAD-IA family hydrolase [Eggerthellaceae bacterium]
MSAPVSLVASQASGRSASPKAQGLLFDADGTLIDTYEIILCSMRYALNEVEGLGLSDAELMAGVGTPLRDQMLHFAQGDEEKADELLVRYRAHNDIVHDERIAAFPDTRAALERFRSAGIPMGVVTSKRHAMAQRGLEMSGIAEFFDVLIAPDDWPEHKPAPGPILRAASLMGLDPTACFYIGDSPFDIQAGNAAGCTSVAALWGMFSAEVLAQENPALEFNSLTGLADYLGV